MANNNPKEPQVKAWDDATINFLDNPNIVEVYINNAKLAMNNFDATLLLGTIKGEKNNKLDVQAKLNVTMSLSFLKTFRDMLDKNIADFESRFGEIQTFDLSKLRS